MKNRFLSVLLILVMLFTSGCIMYPDSDNGGDTGTSENSDNKNEKTVLYQLSLTEDEYDVYAPTAGNSWGYRYGPSAIINDDGSVDMWFASLGTFNEADYITYRHSPDGTNWDDEKIVLRPNPGTLDRFSCCDPGVICFGGYYYIGYTSTIYSSGLCNSIFVARSQSPDGPYEKWNGQGWGGDPAPIIAFDGDSSSWGIGEVSFVEVDGTLYIYYTLRSTGGDYTMVATADSTSPDWCGNIKKSGTALKMGKSQSGADVKYCEDYDNFIAVAVTYSFTEDSIVRVYTSDDGIYFDVSDSISTDIHEFSHNIGISGSPAGHIVLGEKTFISYAYGEKWGRWSTCIAGVNVEASNEVDISDLDGDRSGGEIIDFPPMSSYPDIGITTSPRSLTATVGQVVSFKSYTVTNLFRCNIISDISALSFSGWDEKVISLDENANITALSAGKTSVTVAYGNYSVNVPITVFSEGIDLDCTTPAVISFVPVTDIYTVSMTDIYYKQIRGFAYCENGKSGDAFNSTLDDAFFPASDYPVSYTAADNSICEIGPTGNIITKATGETTVTVSLSGFSFDVKVIVEN